MRDRADRTGAAEFVWLRIARIDAAGRVRLIERFKADNLHLAVARLIELHADDELPPEGREGRYVVASRFREHGPQWSDDAVLIDHRPASLGTLRGGDAIRDAASNMRSLSADLQWRVTDVLVFTERLTLTEAQDDLLLLAQFRDDGLVDRSAWFRPDQADEAFSHFDELSLACGTGEFPPPDTAPPSGD